MRMFWRERQEQEAKDAMTALDKMVNPPPKPEKKNAWIGVHCCYCNASLAQDPAQASRFMCHECGTVITVTVEQHPTS